MPSPFASLKLVGAFLKDAGTFESGKPISVDIPEATTVVDLSEYGMGNVKITEGGSTITVQKV